MAGDPTETRPKLNVDIARHRALTLLLLTSEMEEA